MTIKHISCVATAKLVRQVLKESFPSVKFWVKSHRYANGASIQVAWNGGPYLQQVAPITNKFKGAYFDGLIDYQGSVYHMLDGEMVSFGADYVMLAHMNIGPGMEPRPSKTAGRVFITHDDGYSRAAGSGFNAVTERVAHNAADDWIPF